MASPNTYETRSADNGAVTLHCVFPVGAAGAVGTVTRSKEFATTPVTHVSTGLYRLTTREPWVEVLNHIANTQQATYSTSGACLVDFKTYSLTAGTFDFEFRTIAGVLVDPADGDKVRITLELQLTKP